MSELPKPDYARNMRVVGYTDQGGRPDGVQVMHGLQSVAIFG